MRNKQSINSNHTTRVYRAQVSSTIDCPFPRANSLTSSRRCQAGKTTPSHRTIKRAALQVCRHLDASDNHNAIHNMYLHQTYCLSTLGVIPEQALPILSVRWAVPPRVIRWA